MKNLKNFDLSEWNSPLMAETQEAAVKSLESGKVLFFPSLSFSLKPEEKKNLTPECADPKSKNISYDIRTDHLNGTLYTGSDALVLKEMIKRYAITSKEFLNRLIPHYKDHIFQAKTSFRPVEIDGRKNPSYRKDDTLLHVDSFPSNPTKGKRILRLFTNINPFKEPRVWKVGEPFEEVVKKFGAKAPSPIFGLAPLLKLLKITKDIRTPYDHYMLKMHDAMKGDFDYQRKVDQETILFPAGSSWMVFTDQVSHAALKGQYVLEQTFHLPVKGLKYESLSPLRTLEKHLKKTLI